jgi:hypothetical protein
LREEPPDRAADAKAEAAAAGQRWRRRPRAENAASRGDASTASRAKSEREKITRQGRCVRACGPLLREREIRIARCADDRRPLLDRLAPDAPVGPASPPMPRGAFVRPLEACFGGAFYLRHQPGRTASQCRVSRLARVNALRIWPRRVVFWRSFFLCRRLCLWIVRVRSCRSRRLIYSSCILGSLRSTKLLLPVSRQGPYPNALGVNPAHLQGRGYLFKPLDSAACMRFRADGAVRGARFRAISR